MFPKITASGCLLSCVCGAFLAVAEKDKYLDAATEAVLAYTIAGELASQSLSLSQLGQFYVRLIDALSALDASHLNQYAKISIV